MLKRDKLGRFAKIKLDEEKIRDLYVNQEKSLKEIERIFRVSWSTILNRLKKRGIKIRKRGGKELDLDIKRIRDLYLNKKLSITEISKIFCVSRKVIIKRLNEIKVKRREGDDRKNLDVELIKDLYINKRKPMNEIAKILKVSPPTIKLRLKEKGITIRKSSEYEVIDLDLNKIKDLYLNKKLSSLKIAKILGVCKYTILKRLKEMGVKMKSRREYSWDPYRIQLDEEKIKDLYLNQKKSIIEIGKMFGVSCDTIYNRLKENNIKIKSFSESHKGKHSSPETEFKKGIKFVKDKKWIKNQANSLKKFYLTSEGIQKKIQARKTMKQVRMNQIFPLKDSSIEVKIQNFLKKLGIEFFTHQKMNIEHSYQCDILIPSMNLVIECDGDFIHCNPTMYSTDFVRYPNSKTNQPASVVWEMDKIRTKELIEKGFKVLRLWECEIRKMEINEFNGLLKELK